MILQGHVLDKLAEIPPESVHCVVTSPPYWGLRNYGTDPVVWGGDDSDCGHEWGNIMPPRGQSGWHTFKHQYQSPGAHKTTIGAKLKPSPEENPGHGQFCLKCGAWLGTLGLEPTPELYLQHMVEVFAAVHRVLRKDGTLWLVLGDSYWGGKGRSGQQSSEYQADRQDVSLNKLHHQVAGPKTMRPSDGRHEVYKPKDLCGIPWRVAFALQEYGWWLRSDIVWSKPNPMPESVTDRPTSAHEYIFLFTKSRRYFYDAEAIKEAQAGYERKRRLRELEQGLDTKFNISADGKTGQQPQSNGGMVRNARARQLSAIVGTRNSRTVWEIATQPLKGIHFATFPEEIPRRAIMAGTSAKGCCPECGAPWKRKMGEDCGYTASTTIGWEASCKCGNKKTPPCTVLDTFGGSGTVGKVAQALGRNWVLIELKPEYCEMSQQRAKTQMGLRLA